MAGREDLSDERDPNPDKRADRAEGEIAVERLEGRSFAGANVANAQRDQAAGRRDGPARGNRSDDVQAGDRSGETAALEGEAEDADRAHRVNSARTGLDAERRAETGEQL